MELSLYDIALIPLISGLVEVFKQVGLPKKYSSLFSIGIGLFIGVLYIEPVEMKKGILIGLMLGLSASGLYSGTKSFQETLKPSTNKKENS